MKFISTRGGSNGVSLTFEEALLSGFAPDGGMMVLINLRQFAVFFRRISRVFQLITYTLLSFQKGYLRSQRNSSNNGVP